MCSSLALSRPCSGLTSAFVNPQTDTEQPVEDLIGTRIPVKFLEVDRPRGRLVFSARKVANEKEMPAFKVSFLDMYMYDLHIFEVDKLCGRLVSSSCTVANLKEMPAFKTNPASFVK